MTIKQQKTIGILALQGAFGEHAAKIEELGHFVQLVKQPTDLSDIDALIIPGGESTSMITIMEMTGLKQPINDYIKHHSVMGTCAGLILLAKIVIPDQFSFRQLSVEVERNAYGSQLDSFQGDIILHESFGSDSKIVPGVFIRAPRIKNITDPSVEVLGTFEGEPVLIRQGCIFGMTFHPELTNDTSIHRLFLEMV